MIIRACIALVALAGPAAAQRQIPIRTLTAAISTDPGVIADASMLHGLSNGSVLVNDGVRRRLLLLDSTLKHFRLVADTAGEAPNKFGNSGIANLNAGGLLLFPGDSTAFVDYESRALIVVDAAGNFGRVTTPPNVWDMRYLAGNGSGGPGFDARGRLYYLGGIVGAPTASFAPVSRAETTYVVVDSAPIVRADFDARRLDTVAMMRVARRKFKLIRMPGFDGSLSSLLVNPLPITDDWTYFADGTVAIVRSQDYHVDWFLPNGTHTSSAKLPFDWRRVTDDEKKHIIDSTQHAIDSTRAVIAARLAADKAARVPSLAGGAPPPPPGMMVQAREVLKPEDLPDYYPPLRSASQVRVDPNGNMWILPTTSLHAKGGLLYDVVNREGVVVERVQLPAGRNLQGFGPGGVVFMSVPAALQAQYGWPRVERARIIRP